MKETENRHLMFFDIKKSVLFGMATALVLLIANISPSLGAVQPRYGGTLIICEDEGPKPYDGNYKINDYECQFLVYNRLVQQGYTSGETVGDLAKSWTPSADFKTWTFTLYDNVTWHDGVAFSSADVKFTFDSIQSENGREKLTYAHVINITTPNTYTVVFNLNQSDAVLPFKMSPFGAPCIIPKHLYEGTDPRTNPYNNHPIGTGPFKWSNDSTSSYTVLVKNENYFRGEPYLDKIIDRYIPEKATMLAALKTNEIQASHIPIPASAHNDLKNDPNIRLYYPLQDSAYNLSFNMTVPPFNDARVRRAVACAINVSDINYRLYLGKAGAMKTAFLPKPEWVPSTDPAAQLPTFDPAEAEQLLDDAGYPRGTDGVRISCDYYGFTSQDFRDFSAIIKQHLSSVGININVISLDSPTFNAKIYYRHDWEGMAAAGGYLGWDPSGMAMWYLTGNPNNGNLYSNARVDELFALGASTDNITQRKVYYDELQTILAQELPRFPFILRVKTFANRVDYHGFYWEPEAGKTVNYKQIQNVWWDGGTLPETPGTDLTPRVSALENNITSIVNQISSLSSQLSTMTIVAAAAVIVAVASIAFVVLRRPKKP